MFTIPELLAPEVSPSNEFGGSSLTCIKGSPDWGNKGLLSSNPSSLSSLQIEEWWVSLESQVIQQTRVNQGKGSVLQQSAISCHLQCGQPVWALIHVLVAPFLIQLPDNSMGKAAQNGPKSWSHHPSGLPWTSTWTLYSAWPSHSHGGHKTT